MTTPRARNSDPEISHLAASRLRGLAKEHRRILAAFERLGNMTDTELEAHAREQHWPYAGTRFYYRRRRSDLKSRGLIAATEQRRVNSHGNTETVWTLNTNLDVESPQTGTYYREDNQQEEIMTNQPDHTTPAHVMTEGAALEEGNVSFRQIDDMWVIEGVGLEEGDTLTVYTKDRKPRQIIVGQVIDSEHGVDTAYFEWVSDLDPALVENGKVIFRKMRGEWVVQGLDLSEGEEVEATTREGKARPILITDIINTEDNLVTARYQPLDVPDTITFTKHPHGKGYAVKGLDLIEGAQVPVIKKSGKPTRVTITSIIDTQENGVMIAEFDWAN